MKLSFPENKMEHYVCQIEQHTFWVPCLNPCLLLNTMHHLYCANVCAAPHWSVVSIKYAQ